ncbi:hypothetical protein ACJW8F_12515, partial [Plesiomonas shigelloides]|uniref:hypothetical protein n=1 Tax=Plesiomonas shigelloides TaxID=703 RepID=UPI00387F1DCF
QISEEPILADGLFVFSGFVFVFSSSFPAISLFNLLFFLSFYLFIFLSFYTLAFGLLIDDTSI